MNDRRDRYPSPFTPLPGIARATLPGQETPAVPPPRPRERRPQPTPPPAVEAIAQTQEVGHANPVLTITADVTLPHTDGYARRVNNLLRMLRAALEEEAPWLSNVEITISASSLPRR